MRIMRFTILAIIGVVSLANLNQFIFQVPTVLSLGSIAILFLAAASILGLPILQKKSVFFSPSSWLITCLFLQLFLLIQATGNLEFIQHAGFIPYAVIEITLLLLLSGLAYKVSEWLQKLDEQVALTAVYPTITEIPTLDKAEPIIHNEMTRSRHYERPLAIIAFRLKTTNISTQDFNQSTLEKTQEAQLIQHLRSQMHDYQHIVRDPTNSLYYLICPELNYALAEKFGQHINETIISQTNITIYYASASFPEDGFTFNKVRKEALKRMTTTQPDISDKTPITNP